MDHELKQRLIGAVVVTALAAIFIPMLFDDPVDNSAKAVAEMTAPPTPAAKSVQAESLPANKAQVLTNAEPDLKVSEFEENSANPVNGAQNISPVDKDLITKPAPNTGNDIAESPTSSQPSLQNESGEVPSLDTGDVIPPEEEGEDNVVAVPKVKKPVKDDEKTVKKSAVEKANADKIKVKKQLAVAEKMKSLEDVQEKDSTLKSNGKLVRWSLQAGSFSKKENAQAALDKLRKQGFPATMVAKGNLFRIKIGPELDKKKAVEMKSKLAAQKIQSYLQSE